MNDSLRTKYEPQEIRTWGECTFDNENFRELADYIESLQGALNLAAKGQVEALDQRDAALAEVERLRAIVEQRRGR